MFTKSELALIQTEIKERINEDITYRHSAGLHKDWEMWKYFDEDLKECNIIYEKIMKTLTEA